MRITIDDHDRYRAEEAFLAQVRYWFRGRRGTSPLLRAYHHRETRAAIRLLRAARRAK